MDVQATCNEALRHHQAGRLPEAERLYRVVLAEQPNHPGVLHMLGLLAYQTGHLQPALQLIRAAIDIDPTTADYYVNLGTVLGRVGPLDEAITAYRKALSLRADSAASWNNLAQVMGQKGWWRQAIILYRQAIALDPADATSRANLARASQQAAQADPPLLIDVTAMLANSKPTFHGKSKHRWAIVFVCQQGRLDTQAALLAASLRRFVRFEHELIAALPMPEEQWGRPTSATLKFLAKLGVRLVPVANGINHNYPIANKLGCLSIPTEAERIIFIDTDALIMRPWEEDDRLSVGISARPELVSIIDDTKRWERIYAACGAAPMMKPVRAIFSEQLMAAYFNSGVISAPANSNLSDLWLDCCRRVDQLDIPDKRPYLDQIALSPAIARSGLTFENLDEQYNHQISLKPMEEGNLPAVCHYQMMSIVQREPAAVRLIREMMAEDADLAAIVKAETNWARVTDAAELKAMLTVDPDWSTFAKPVAAKLAQRGRDVVITGIPRSGTSYLCNLLHRYENCVVLNEPAELPFAIQENVPLWRLARFFGEMRRQILLGKPVPNKLTNGKVTEDTARDDQITEYHPRVSGGDFVLGVKWTMEFLNRLPQIRKVMPDAVLVACVRNPYDTIASWKTTFSHLKDANVDAVPVGNPRDETLDGSHRQELRRIAATRNLAVRRAMWWRYFAELVLANKEHLIIVRYPDLVQEPMGILGKILNGAAPGRLLEPVEPSTIRSKVDALDAEDVSAIQSICAESARALGVYRDES